MDLRTINTEVEALRKILDSKHSQWCLCLVIPTILMKATADDKVLIMPMSALPKPPCPNFQTIDIDVLADELYDKIRSIDDMNKFELRLLQIIAKTKDGKEIVRRIRAAVRHDRAEAARYMAEWSARDEARDKAIQQAPATPIGQSKNLCYTIYTKKAPPKPRALSMDEVKQKIAIEFGD